MAQQTRNRDWLFLLACIALGLLVEQSFFHGKIGVSYLIFITIFYFVFFWRFQLLFKHRRIGSLLMVAIWLMAGSYLFNDHSLFYYINLLFIPLLIFFQLILITSPAKLNWSKLSFMRLVTGKFMDAMKYLVHYVRFIMRRLLHRKTKRSIGRRVVVGLLFSVPILMVVIHLLSNMDGLFHMWLVGIPLFENTSKLVEVLLRLGMTLLAALVIFSVFQVVGRRTKRDILLKDKVDHSAWDGIVIATIFIGLSLVYMLFLLFEIPYFRSAEIETRIGYLPLLVVILFNWILLVLSLKRVKTKQKSLRILLKILYSTFIFITGLLILTVINRLTYYEEIYGFTLDRLLIYLFMLFLLVIFAYTLIRVWIEKISMLHFYLITGLLFYMIIQIINIEGIVVENNIERYKNKNEVDIHYMSQMGAEGIKGLVTIYELEPENTELQHLLKEAKDDVEEKSENWQGFNFAREEAKQLLNEIEVKTDEEVGMYAN